MNIRDRRLELHLTLEEVGEKVGVGKSTVRKWEAGAIKNMGRDKIVALAKALKMSPLEIIDPDHKLPTNIVDKIKETVMELSTPRQNKVYDFAKRQLDEQNGKSITVGRATAAGNPLCGETQDSEEQHLVVNRDEIPRGADEVITIAGDSMEPLLPKGSQQFIHYQPTPDTDGQVMIVRIKDEGVTCKKVYREKDKVRLVSVNDKYKDMVYPAEDVECIGKVILK
ncbi:LexA family transcriptional regulator [Ligilactobacillus sp. LYQ135]